MEAENQLFWLLQSLKMFDAKDTNYCFAFISYKAHIHCLISTPFLNVQILNGACYYWSVVVHFTR